MKKIEVHTVIRKEPKLLNLSVSSFLIFIAAIVFFLLVLSFLFSISMLIVAIVGTIFSYQFLISYQKYFEKIISSPPVKGLENNPYSLSNEYHKNP